MYSLEIIKNARPQLIRDNFNRDSSAIFSRGGFVIHSAIHRSTAFVGTAEGIQSLRFWQDFGQAAKNAWIEATCSELALVDCEAAAIRALWPEWTFTVLPAAGKSKSAIVTAIRPGNLETRISGKDWQDLQARLYVLNERGAL